MASPPITDVSHLLKPKLNALIRATTAGGASSQRSVMQDLRHVFNSQHLNEATLPIFIELLVGTLDSNDSSVYYIHVPTHADQPSPLAIAIARLTAHLLHSASVKQLRLPLPSINRLLAGLVSWLQLDSCTTRSLHVSCANLISAIANAVSVSHYPQSISSNLVLFRASASVESISRPLLNALASRIEPVSVGAAVCLQALIQSTAWKSHASFCLAADVCRGAASALNARPSRNVDSAHIGLVSELTKTNSLHMEEFGSGMLSKAAEILRFSSEWQQRAAASGLAERLLCLLSNVAVLQNAAMQTESLKKQLNDALQTLEECRHDKAAAVRSAVSKALQKVASTNTQQTPVSAAKFDGSIHSVLTPSEVAVENTYVTPPPVLMEFEAVCKSYVSRSSSSRNSSDVRHDVDIARHAVFFGHFGLDDDDDDYGRRRNMLSSLSTSSPSSTCTSASVSDDAPFICRRNFLFQSMATSYSSDSGELQCRPSISGTSRLSDSAAIHGNIVSGDVQSFSCMRVEASTPDRDSPTKAGRNDIMSDNLQLMKCETPAVPRRLISRFDSIQQQQEEDVNPVCSNTSWISSLVQDLDCHELTSMISSEQLEQVPDQINDSGLIQTVLFNHNYPELDYAKPDDEPMVATESTHLVNMTADLGDQHLVNHGAEWGDGDSVNLAEDKDGVHKDCDTEIKTVSQICPKCRSPQSNILLQSSGTVSLGFSFSRIFVIVFVYVLLLLYKYFQEELERRNGEFLRPT